MTFAPARLARDERQPLVAAAVDRDAGELRRAVEVRPERERERIGRRHDERHAIDRDVVGREVADQAHDVGERIGRRRGRGRAVGDRGRIDAGDRGHGRIDELAVEELRNPGDHVGADERLGATGSTSMTSSFVSTMMPATFETPSEVDEKASFVTGFGFASPTQPYVPPAVCVGTFVLNGTWRRPGILPRIVAGRRSSMNSLAMFWLTSGVAQVASVVVPGATAALRYSATSGRRIRSSAFRRTAIGVAHVALADELRAGGADERGPERHVRLDRDRRARDRGAGAAGTGTAAVICSFSCSRQRPRSASMHLDLHRQAVVLLGLRRARASALRRRRFP